MDEDASNSDADVMEQIFSIPVESGKTYWITARICYTAAADTNNIKCQWGGIVGGEAESAARTFMLSAAAVAGSVLTMYSDAAIMDPNGSAGALGGERVCRLTTRLVCLETGNLTLSFAPDDDDGLVTAKAGSHVVVRETTTSQITTGDITASGDVLETVFSFDVEANKNYLIEWAGNADGSSSTNVQRYFNNLPEGATFTSCVFAVLPGSGGNLGMDTPRQPNMLRDGSGFGQTSNSTTRPYCESALLRTGANGGTVLLQIDSISGGGTATIFEGTIFNIREVADANVHQLAAPTGGDIASTSDSVGSTRHTIPVAASTHYNVECVTGFTTGNLSTGHAYRASLPTNGTMTFCAFSPTGIGPTIFSRVARNDTPLTPSTTGTQATEAACIEGAHVYGGDGGNLLLQHSLGASEGTGTATVKGSSWAAIEQVSLQ